MRWSLEHLRGFSLRATDDTLGKVKDFLFDDDSWTVRYMVADTSRWLFGRSVLIASEALGHPDIAEKAFAVDLTRERIKNSPEIDVSAPIGREQEDAVRAYYGWPPYGAPAVAAAPDAGDDPTTVPLRSDLRLRSGHDLTGFTISAKDDTLGRVEDFLIDEDGWRIRYLVVDIGSWLPLRRVVVSPEWVTMSTNATAASMST